MNNTPFNQARLGNMQHACSVATCQAPRAGLSRYCRAHTRLASQYGHPMAKPICRQDYSRQYDKVKELFKVNATHEGLKAALQWVQQWIDCAVAGDASVTAAVDIQRLEAYGVTALQILTESCAFYLYETASHRPLPSPRAVDYAMSRAVLSLAPKEKRISPQSGLPIYVQPRNGPLAGIGRDIRMSLSGFFAGVQVAIEQEQSLLEAVKAAMKAPYAVPLSLLAEDSAGPTAKAQADAPAVPQQ